MATQRIEEGEYGVEIITTAPKAEPKPPAQAAPVPEQRAEDAKQEDDEDDEEDMYAQGTSFGAIKEENDGFQVEEGKQMTETLVIFDKNQFLLYDFKNDRSWQVGDVESDAVTIAEDSRIVMIDN